MSANIPFEIQTEIIKRLPVKSLIQFRSVSKAWKSLIDGSDFVARYRGQLQHLLVRYANVHSFGFNYVSFVDDDTFPQHKVSLTVPLLVKNLKDSRIIGCSHGLLCLCVGNLGYYDPEGTAVLWNLSTGKAVAVVVRNAWYRTILGFGVCPETTDPKILKITYNDMMVDNARQVEVFTLSTGAWRRPHGNLPRKSLRLNCYKLGVGVDGVLYWLATDTVTTEDGAFRSKLTLIVSFDMKTEEFGEVNLPQHLAKPCNNKSIGKLRNSLVVIDHDTEAVWMMEDGVPKTFTFLFIVNRPYASISFLFVRGFRKTGEPIIEFLEYDSHSLHERARKLGVYDTYLRQVDHLGINGIRGLFYVHSYMETLLLHDQVDFKVFDTRI